MSIETFIKAVEQADSASRLVQSVVQLAQTKDPAAIPTLVSVLKFNNPGAAVAAVEGLINIGAIAIPYILENVDDYNYGARAWTIRVFAGLGDPRTIDLLIEAANTDFSLSVRRAAAKGLGNIQWDQVEAQVKQEQQQKVLDSLQLALQDGEWVVRYGAIAGLEQLYPHLEKAELKQTIIKHLQNHLHQESEIAINARINLALSRIK